MSTTKRKQYQMLQERLPEANRAIGDLQKRLEDAEAALREELKKEAIGGKPCNVSEAQEAVSGLRRELDMAALRRDAVAGALRESQIEAINEILEEAQEKSRGFSEQFHNLLEREFVPAVNRVLDLFVRLRDLRRLNEKQVSICNAQNVHLANLSAPRAAWHDYRGRCVDMAAISETVVDRLQRNPETPVEPSAFK